MAATHGMGRRGESPMPLRASITASGVRPGCSAEHVGPMNETRHNDQGYPIGGSTGETGCKIDVRRRMKRSGRCWGRERGQARLRMPSELHSGRYDRAWQERA